MCEEKDCKCESSSNDLMLEALCRETVTGYVMNKFQKTEVLVETVHNLLSMGHFDAAAEISASLIGALAQFKGEMIELQKHEDEVLARSDDDDDEYDEYDDDETEAEAEAEPKPKPEPKTVNADEKSK